MKANTTQKTLILGVVLVGAIAVAGLQNAGAGPWGGGPNTWGGTPCGCDGYGFRGQPQLDEKTEDARKAFLEETTDLRKQIATRKAEKRALLLNDNPNPKRVAELTGELFDLRENLHDAAKKKGLDNAGYSRGPGRRCGGPGPKGY